MSRSLRNSINLLTKSFIRLKVKKKNLGFSTLSKVFSLLKEFSNNEIMYKLKIDNPSRVYELNFKKIKNKSDLINELCFIFKL